MNYTYRFLGPADFHQFMHLHETKDTFMNQSISIEEKKEYLERLAWLFFQSDYKVAGCFLEDRLDAVIGCRYFKSKMTGYFHGKCFNLSYSGFNYLSLFAEVLGNLTRLITTHAESLGIYQIYMAREFNEGQSIHRLYNRTINKNPISITDIRYIYMMDKIYKPGDTEILEPHEFFFKPHNVVTRDTLVSFLILKPELREEILRINQQP